MATTYLLLLKRSVLILSLFCWGLSAVYAQADKLSVTVYVIDQSNETRVDAFKEAIDIAMRRLTGKLELNEPVHDQIRDFASRYVRGFRYLSKGKADVEAKPITGVRKLLLKVDFNSSTLRKALDGTEGVNANTRLPKILFWVTETAAGKRQVISAGKLSTTAIALKQYSTARGIKMVLPKYDSKESLMVSALDIAGGFDGNVLDASRAYIVDRVATLNLEQLPNKTWRGAWTLLQDTERSKWTSMGRNRNEAISKGINELKNVIDNIAVVNISVAADILVEIQNIDTLEAYAKVSEYLKSLTSIRQVSPVNIKNDRIIYSLQLQADQSRLVRQIAQHNILRTVLNPQLNIGEINSRIADLTFFYQAN